jgi:periplasmic protein CpxP/Spy
MSKRNSTSEVPPSARRSWTRWAAYVAAAVIAVGLAGAFAGTSFSQGLRHRLLVNVNDGTVTSASFDGRFGPDFGPGFGAGAPDWTNGLLNGAIEAIIDARAYRMIRHIAVEIDATTEQQDKLRAVVNAAVKDLLPVREKVLAARAAGRDLLIHEPIDRAALEKLRVDQIAVHDAASKRLVLALADIAEVLTPEQRRKLNDLMPPRGGWGGWSPWGRGRWGN